MDCFILCQMLRVLQVLRKIWSKVKRSKCNLSCIIPCLILCTIHLLGWNVILKKHTSPDILCLLFSSFFFFANCSYLLEKKKKKNLGVLNFWKGLMLRPCVSSYVVETDKVYSGVKWIQPVCPSSWPCILLCVRVWHCHDIGASNLKPLICTYIRRKCGAPIR